MHATYLRKLTPGLGLLCFFVGIIVEDRIYDCTHFVDIHPGGREVFAQFGGKQCTWQVSSPLARMIPSGMLNRADSTKCGSQVLEVAQQASFGRMVWCAVDWTG